MEKELKIPKISDDIDEATVSKLLVGEGDSLKEGDPILEVESDKASAEIPADYGGKVSGIKVSKGDKVKIGDVVMTVEIEEKEEEENSEAKSKKPEQEKEKSKARSEQPDQEEEKSEASPSSGSGSGTEEEEEREEIPVAPLASKLANELGIELSQLSKSGERLTSKDVIDHVRTLLEEEKSKESEEKNELPDFSRWGKTERKPLSSIRKSIAKSTQQSWRNIPHVSHHDKAKISKLQGFIEKESEESDSKISLTAVLLKVIGEALEEFPNFNASLDLQAEEVVFKDYINLSVAVDTKKGLLLPVIRDISQKSISQLAEELSKIAEKARSEELYVKDMEGGNFTLSNLGGIGGNSFTPIIYPPQVAILGVSKAETQAIFKNGEFKPESILPLSLSYDHRMIDGADAARFLRWICEAIEQPMNLMLN